MGRTITEVDKPQLDFNTVSNIMNFIPVYDKHEDTLFCRPDKPRPATSVDWNGEIWIRVDPENGEIVGLEIDEFEAVFLKKHPELIMVWEEIKPLCRKKKAKKSEEPIWESFLRIILNFLIQLFRENPKQASLGIA